MPGEDSPNETTKLDFQAEGERSNKCRAPTEAMLVFRGEFTSQEFVGRYCFAPARRKSSTTSTR